MTRSFLALSLLTLLFASPTFAEHRSRGDSWPLGGHGLGNNRNNPHVDLHPRQLRDMEVAWSKDLEGNAWTQPTVGHGKVFMTDNAGYIYAFDAVDGTTIWKRFLADLWHDANAPTKYAKPKFAASRSAPVVTYSKKHSVPIVITADQAGNPTLPDTPKDGANIYSINANTGELVALAKVANPLEKPGEDFTVLTGAMTVYNGKLYTGVSGLAEANPECIATEDAVCTFRGRVMCFDVDTLELEWETYTVPENPFAGGSVWGSTPAVDVKRNQLLVGTGDNYQIPEKIQACVVEAKKRFGTLPNAEAHPDAVPAIKACVDADPRWADNHFDSVLALDLDTGKINWSLSTLLYDTWNLGCLSSPDWPTYCGPDMDFSQHPMLVSMRNDHTRKRQDIVVVGQKNGTMFGLSPKTGKVRWKTTENRAGSRFEPGTVGGFQNGSAWNGHSVIGLNGNSFHVEHTLRGRKGRSTMGGTIVGFNPRTGRVRWETPAKRDNAFATGLLNDITNILFGRSIDPEDPPAVFGAPSCAGRVCFWGTMGTKGYVFATDTMTGKTIWKRPANGSLMWGGAIVEIPKKGIYYYVGSGYSSFATGVAAEPGANFWAYRIPQKKRRGRGRR